MTYMLNKLLNLTEKGKYLFAPCLCPVQASQLSMSRFILIEINIHISVIITGGQEPLRLEKPPQNAIRIQFQNIMTPSILFPIAHWKIYHIYKPC